MFDVPTFEVMAIAGWQHFAEQLLADLGERVQRRGSPTWLRVYEGPDADVGLTVTSDDPRFLIGWTAPAGCAAVGIVATGRTRAIGEAGVSTSFAPERDGVQVRMCCVVSRSGEVGWTLQVSSGQTSLERPTEGKILDSLKRCLELPTSPPGIPASELHAAAWAASVLDRAIESPRQLTWSDVERLHPVARLLGGDLAAVDDDRERGSDDLTDLVRVAANAWSWEEIRAQACDGELEALIDPDLASWMDVGMFSRWVMERTPPLDQLLGALRAYLAPSAAIRFESALA